MRSAFLLLTLSLLAPASAALQPQEPLAIQPLTQSDHHIGGTAAVQPRDDLCDLDPSR